MPVGDLNLNYESHQVRQMFGHIAGMLFQSRVHGIGRALRPSKKMQRHGTMRWGDASGDIGDKRWTGFVKVNFMRSMLLLLPCEDTNVDSEQYKASARLSAPLNGAAYQATFESCILQSREERKDMGWPDTFDVMGDMSSSHLATKLKAEDTVDDTIEKEGGSISLLDNVKKIQKEKPLPLTKGNQEKWYPEKWQMSTDFTSFNYRAKTDTVQTLLRWTTLENRAANGLSLTAGETDMWAQVNHVCSPELYDDEPPGSKCLFLPAYGLKPFVTYHFPYCVCMCHGQQKRRSDDAY